ncbi:protein ABHD14A isoform X4 [Canis aureus]
MVCWEEAGGSPLALGLRTIREVWTVGLAYLLSGAAWSPPSVGLGGAGPATAHCASAPLWPRSPPPAWSAQQPAEPRRRRNGRGVVWLLVPRGRGPPWGVRPGHPGRPGFGNSAPSKEANTEAGRAELLERVLRDLEVHNAVLVSPSLSGRYALPFLIQGHHQLRGFVPIAPASTQNYTQEQFWAVKTPTLILYGELDRILARESLRQLRHLPNHSVVKLRDAGHACYLHKPQDFHLVLLAFLDHLP